MKIMFMDQSIWNNPVLFWLLIIRVFESYLKDPFSKKQQNNFSFQTAKME